MKKTLLLLFFCFVLKAQSQITGIVKDASTNEVLPFASILFDNEKGTTSDVTGKFILNDNSIKHFTVSYLGYTSQNIHLDNTTSYFTVLLNPKTDQLKGVILKNSKVEATQLIEKVIASKNKNNPQVQLESFQFKSYNKLIATANPDSISPKIEYNINKKGEIKSDSSDYKFKKLLSKQHLFQTEKVSIFQFQKPNVKETVIGTKMAGLKEPIYEIIAFNLQSFSIYDNRYELFETKYNSPISNSALLDYTYTLLDTTSIENRETYVVYYRNKRKKNKAGLEGLLFIDAENYAVAKAVMRIRGVLDITAIHEFTYLEEKKLWFHIKKEFKIVKGKSDDDINILGETIKFEGKSDDNQKLSKKYASDYFYLISTSYFSDFQLNIPLKITHPSIYLDIKEEAIHKEEPFWISNRNEPLDQRSLRTYASMDSILNRVKVESRLRLGRKIINGYVPFGPIDLDLRYLLSYNNYEGFRFGLGGVTSEKFSEKVRIEGYFAYGTKDGQFKEHIGSAFRVEKYSNTWIGGSYTDDVREIASTNFAIDKRVFKLYDPRPINISTFYNHQTYRGFIETKIIPKTESIWQFTHSRVEPKFGYAYLLNDQIYSVFRMTTASVSIQWNPYSEFMQTPKGRFEIEKSFPKFTFQFTQALPKVLENDFEFGKIDFRTEYEKKYLNGQKTSFLIQAGYAFGDVPLTHLYSTSPNSLTKDKIIQRITIAGKNSFETMFFNEFFSNKYATFQVKHGFKKVHFFKKVNPAFVLVTRMAWGDMTNKQRHVGIDYKTLRDGFIESGLEINKIYKGFGLSGFYRYGPNQLPRLEDNISLKLNFILDLGF